MQVQQQELKGLIAFCEEHPEAKAIVVSQNTTERLVKISDKIEITILPWQSFLPSFELEKLFNYKSINNRVNVYGPNLICKDISVLGE